MENSGKGRIGVSVAGLLSERLIRTGLAASGKADLMDALVRELCEVKRLSEPDKLLEQVLKREQGISTTLDTGLSLPHARIDGLPDVAAILGFPTKPISDPKIEDCPIRAMFLFFSPNRPEAYAQQLQLLRSIALLFDEAFLNQLVAAATPFEALELIRRQESSIGS